MEDDEQMEGEQNEAVNLIVNGGKQAEAPTEENIEGEGEEEEMEPIQNQLTPEQILQLQQLQQEGQVDDEQLYQLQIQLA